MRRRLKRFGGVVTTVCAIGVAVALYFETQPTSAEQHTRVVDGFGRLQMLDARIAEEALAARSGFSSSYDPLTQSTRQFAEAALELEQELAVSSSANPEIAETLAELQRQAAERARAVEAFKTQNSVLKNSLYYLPLAARQVTELMGRRPAAAAAPDVRGNDGTSGPDPVKEIAELVQLTLTQNLLGGRAETARVEAQLARVAALKPNIAAEAQDRFQLLLAHAGVASRTQQLVDPILRQQVLEAPTKGTLNELKRRYHRWFEGALHEASGYRNILYAWSTLLLTVVLGVAFKLRSLYANLERLVSERTRELNQALNELWGEMELAKKIQTALVPRSLSLKDCEVAAVMRPTDEVGGDYYDVFEVDGTEWVLIGDVSGHGVPAGLVMMMCQTAVHSVIASRPEIGPDELLATVNHTLTQNIERLGEDKYMTISALRRDPDGSFQVAGSHQDLLVYRAASGRVEYLLAQGTWLGIAKNIRGLNPVRRLSLEPGDVLVLYTDGITEATREGRMLDVAGLERAVLARGGDSAQQILTGILQTLEAYEVDDDVAAVVVKQLEPRDTVEVTAA